MIYLIHAIFYCFKTSNKGVKKMFYIVDRIEENIIVLQDDNGHIINLNKNILNIDSITLNILIQTTLII